MKLYYSPLACSLADHIALLEAGVVFERERVDLATKRTASGINLATITPKAYVPVLVLDSGEVLTENIAILDWLAAEYPVLGVAGPLGRTRLIEALAFVSTEIHRSFKPMWHAATDAERSRASAQISALLNQISDTLAGAYLFGDRPSVADFYLFVMLLWAKRFDVETPGRLTSLRERLIRRPAVEAALRHEGLLAALVE